MQFRKLFRLPFGSRRVERDIEEEIRFHIDERARRLVREGYTESDALEQARRRFGAVTAVTHEVIRMNQRHQRRQWRVRVLSALGQDVKFAVRTMLRAPGFTAAAAGTLALGVGATIAIFSVLHTVILRPLPLPDAHRVAWVSLTDGGQRVVTSPGLLHVWREEARNFAALSAFGTGTATLITDGVPRRISGYGVESHFFDVTGLMPVLGRRFEPADDLPGSQPTVMISRGLWTQVFANDSAVVGKTVVLNGESRTIVGVMPDAVRWSSVEADYWTPLRLGEAQRENFGARWLEVIGRLAPDATYMAAEGELRLITERLEQRSVDGGELNGVSVTALNDFLLEDVRVPLFLSFGAVILVLLISCGNVANLLLARGTKRAHEFAVRASLGAGRWRIVRQLLVESALLASLAVVGGLVLASWGVSWITASFPAQIPRLDQVTLDATVLWVAVVLGAVTTVLFGLPAALPAVKYAMHARFRSGGRPSGVDTSDVFLRRTFVASQVALSTTLLIGASLFIRGAVALQRVDPGFDPRGVLTASVALPSVEYPRGTDVATTMQQLADAASSAPGVTAATVVTRVPLGGYSIGWDFAAVGGDARSPARIRLAGHGFAETLGLNLRGGRDFNPFDKRGSTRVAVINETLAKRLELGPQPIGRHIYGVGSGIFADSAGHPAQWEVVGVVADVRDQGLKAAHHPELYLPMAQAPAAPWEWMGRQAVLAVRTGGDPSNLATPLAQAVRSVDPNLPIFGVRTMMDRLNTSMAIERFSAQLLGVLGAVGLILTLVGVFAVVAFAVERRVSELGVRLALGASAAGLLRLVVRQEMIAVSVGLLVGLVGALTLARAFSGFLFGVGPSDPVAVTVAVVLVVTTAVVACWLPARRVTRIDPVRVLSA